MVGVARGALFKRIEDEKGFGGWDPTPRRGIQAVGITESTRESPPEPGPPPQLHPRSLHGLRHL